MWVSRAVAMTRRPGAQGIAALMALNSLEQDAGFLQAAWGSAEHLHALVESMRLGFVDALAYNADPEATGVPTADLLSKEYAKRRRAQLFREGQARICWLTMRVTVL